MKILQMVDVPWDSGLAHYALVLAQGLKQKGHKVFVSAVPGEKPWAKARRLGLKTVPMATFKGLAPLRRFLREQKIEVINAHTGSTHSLAVAAALGSSIAVIRTRSDARGVRKNMGTSLLFRRTQRVIAAADYIRRDYLKNLKLPAAKVVTIYQGYDLDNHEVQAIPRAPIIGIIARLDPVKGHRYLIEALSILRASHPMARLRIVGQEENVKQHELLAMAERLRLENRVEFLGYRKDIPWVAAGCAIGVVASTGSEAVSRVALEWMASGRPVVATKVGCLPEIVKDPQTGFLVEPASAPALARGIGHLLNHPEKMALLGRAGRARVEKEFSMEEFVRATEKVYKEALNECQN